MTKAVFLLGTFDACGKKKDAPELTPESMAFLDEVEAALGVEAHIVYAVPRRKFAGKEKEVTVGVIKEERAHVVRQIRDIAPEHTFLFGRTALFSALGRGGVTLDDYRRRPVPVSDFGGRVHLVDGLPRVFAQSGIRDWVKMDALASLNGQNTTEWGDYTLMLPGGIGDGDHHELLRHKYPDIHLDYAWDEPPAELLDDMGIDRMMGFDLETYPGLDPWAPDARIRMAMVSTRPGRAWIIQCPSDSSLPRWLEDILADDTIVKCGSNIAFDYKWCRRFGVEVNNMWDTSVAQHILNENDPNTGLKYLTFRYLPRLGDYSREQRDLVKKRGGWEFVEDWEQYDYAAADAEASIAAALGQAKLLKVKGLTQAWTLSKDLYPVLSRMQADGAAVSEVALHDLDRKYGKHLVELRRRICAVLGPINPDSPKQLAEALVANIEGISLYKDIPNAWRRNQWDEDDDEKESTKRAILEREAHRSPVIADVLEFRKWSKLHGTYIKGILEKHMVKHGGGSFIHASYNQNRVDTNRLSSSNPNKQNIPRKPEEDENYNPDLNVKQIFCSRWGEEGRILEADFSQVELRIAAMLSQDPNMLRVVESGADIHTATAALVAGKTNLDDVTKEERQRAKAINFGIIFGQGAKSLGIALGVSKAQAKEFIRTYFDNFPELERHIESVHQRVQEDLQVQSPFGFVRRFTEPPQKLAGDGDRWNQWEGWRIQRQAFNMLVQNTAACVTFVSIVEMERRMREARLRTIMFSTVHDSILFDVFPGELEAVAALAKEVMENPPTERYGVEITVPLTVDIEVGNTWGDKEEYA